MEKPDHQNSTQVKDFERSFCYMSDKKTLQKLINMMKFYLKFINMVFMKPSRIQISFEYLRDQSESRLIQFQQKQKSILENLR